MQGLGDISAAQPWLLISMWRSVVSTQFLGTWPGCLAVKDCRCVTGFPAWNSHLTWQDYERSASSLLFSNTEDSFLVGSPTARVCAQEVGELQGSFKMAFQDCGFSVEDVQAAGKIRSIREGAQLAGLVGTREFGGLGASMTFANLTVGLYVGNGTYMLKGSCLMGNDKTLPRWEALLMKFWLSVNLEQTAMMEAAINLAG